MIKTPIYTYLGTNGTLTTPIHLEGIYAVVKYQLDAEGDKFLTKDNKSYVKTVLCPESEVALWKEVSKKAKI